MLSSYDLMNYYFRCVGNNPVEEYQADIQDFATDLQSTLETLLNDSASPCKFNK